MKWATIARKPSQHEPHGAGLKVTDPCGGVGASIGSIYIRRCTSGTGHEQADRRRRWFQPAGRSPQHQDRTAPTRSASSAATRSGQGRYRKFAPLRRYRPKLVGQAIRKSPRNRKGSESHVRPSWKSRDDRTTRRDVVLIPSGRGTILRSPGDPARPVTANP